MIVLTDLAKEIRKALDKRAVDNGAILQSFDVHCEIDKNNNEKINITIVDMSHDHGQYPMQAEIDFAKEVAEELAPEFKIHITNESAEELQARLALLRETTAPGNF